MYGNNSQLKSSLLLLLTAAIWGVAFVAQSVGMEYVGPFTFNSVRCFIGMIVLSPVCLILRRKDRAKGVSSAVNRRTLIEGGLVCGVFLCLASNFQ